MITFLVCLALLVTAYFVYGGLSCRLWRCRWRRGVPLPRRSTAWTTCRCRCGKSFLIQLLNIAGLGPIFGAVLGAAYGPVAFVWITLGGIFMGGGMHDLLSGFISLRHRGASLPRSRASTWAAAPGASCAFAVGLMMVLVGGGLPVAARHAHCRGDRHPGLAAPAWGGFSRAMLAVLGAILIYYVTATLLPIDRIIGRFYPVFGFLLFFMAAGILGVLLFGGRYSIPELTSLRNGIADAGALSDRADALHDHRLRRPCRDSTPRSRRSWPGACNRSASAAR